MPRCAVRLPILTGPATITGSESYATLWVRMPILIGPATITGSESYATTRPRLPADHRRQGDVRPGAAIVVIGFERVQDRPLVVVCRRQGLRSWE